MPRTFRARLTVVFVVIALLPMMAVSVIMFGLLAASERDKADARLSQARATALELTRETTLTSERMARASARSVELASALYRNDRADLRAEVQRMIDAGAGRVVLQPREGPAVTGGSTTGVAPASVHLVDTDGERVAQLSIAMRSAPTFAALLRRLAGVETVLSRADGEVIASTLRRRPENLPRGGTVQVAGMTYRVASFERAGFPKERGFVISVLTDQRSTRDAMSQDTLLIGLLLLGFLALAFAFALAVSRSLQAPVERLLSAARRLGGGEFDVAVPVDGGDEFAQLGSEFNAMARQLEIQLEDLDAERSRLEGAIRRVGELSAAGLDRDAVLEIVAQTAVDGIQATTGRASARQGPDGAMRTVASVGSGDYEPVLDDTESEAIRRGRTVALRRGDVHAIAQPLHPPDDPSEPVGILTVARDGRPFTGGERDLLGYLASQASISIENVGLHQTVQRQAVTDELTGLSNHRRFQDVVGLEIERAKRFDQPLGLVMLDVDDFKLVNDRYGHLQGDAVLRAVARVLLETAREIDEPTRYGGEEMAVILPSTDLKGAGLFAERLRTRIAQLEVPLVSSEEGTLTVTASLGVAAVPDSAELSKNALVTAADSALYRAKRLGKNRVVTAG